MLRWRCPNAMARSQHPSLQAIVITGFPTPETKSAARTLGVFAYVTKPFGILDILGTCDAAISVARDDKNPTKGV